MTGDPFTDEMLSHLPMVRRVAMKLSRKADEAEDLVQDTVVNALRYRERYTAGTNMRAWLCFICRNLFLSAKRRSWRWTPMDDEWSRAIPNADSPHHCLALKEVLQAMTYLPKEQAEALLAISEGEDYDSAAQQLGCEIGTLKSRVSRARDAIELYFNAA